MGTVRNMVTSDTVNEILVKGDTVGGFSFYNSTISLTFCLLNIVCKKVMRMLVFRYHVKSVLW